MKKILMLAVVLMLSLAPAFADEMTAYVSITDDTGVLCLAAEEIIVTDVDNDGALTIHDAIYCAHVQKHELGAEAFLTENTQWGISMIRLWNVENGGSYGYYLNDASAWSMADPIQAGDHVKAYAYTDLETWSDTYSFFNTLFAEAKVGEEIALTLSAAGFDANFAPITLAASNAVITVNGEATEIKTDAEGKAVISFAEAGVYVISAESEEMNLVAPVCVITVKAGE